MEDLRIDISSFLALLFVMHNKQIPVAVASELMTAIRCDGNEASLSSRHECRDISNMCNRPLRQSDVFTAER